MSESAMLFLSAVTDCQYTSTSVSYQKHGCTTLKITGRLPVLARATARTECLVAVGVEAHAVVHA